MGICKSKKQSSSPHSPQIKIKQQAEIIDSIKEECVKKVDSPLQLSQQDFMMRSMELLTPQKQSTTRKGKFFQNYTLLQDMKTIPDKQRQVVTVQHNITGVTKIAYIQNHNYKQIELANVQAKVQNLKKIDHPNVITISECFFDERSQYIVTDYCSGGNILSRVKHDDSNSKDQLIKFYFKQIFSGLNYLHQNQLLHKSIKPNHVLFQSNQSQLIKLIDYSSIRMKKNDEILDLNYTAPEILKQQSYCEASDIWNCGVLLFHTWTGKEPFTGEDRSETKKNILAGKIQTNKLWNKMPSPAQNIINQMLQVNNQLRPSAADCLKHDYLKDAPQNINDQYLIDNALNQIGQQKSATELKSVLLSLMIQKFLDQGEKERLTLAFQGIDTNKNGKITKDELSDYLKKTKSRGEARQETANIFLKVDKNQNGEIELNEFIQAACDLKKLLTQDNLESFFHMLDRNKNNFITLQELKIQFTEARLTDKEWIQLIGQGDEDHNGKLSFKEFQKLMEEK